MITPTNLAINIASFSGHWDLAAAIQGCARLGIRAIAPQREQLFQYGVNRAARLLREHDMAVSSLGPLQLLPVLTDSLRPTVTDDYHRTLEAAAAINARCVVVMVAGLPPGVRDLALIRARLKEELACLLPYARNLGVRLALEPFHPLYCPAVSCLNTLSHANDLCARLDPEREGGIGLNVDMFHIAWDPERDWELQRAGPERLYNLQLADWLPRPGDHPQRTLPGDGVLDIGPLRDWLRELGYRGFEELELGPLREYSSRSPEEVLTMAIIRYRALLNPRVKASGS